MFLLYNVLLFTPATPNPAILDSFNW